MDAGLDRVLRALDDAVAFATSYRFEATSEYLALIEEVESLPQNRPGTDKSGRWRGHRRERGAEVEPATRPPRP